MQEVQVPPTECSPSGIGCSSMGCPWIQRSSQQPCSVVDSSLHGSCQESVPVLATHGITASFPLGMHLLWHGSPPGAAGGSLLHCSPPWAARAQLLPHVLHMGCRGVFPPALAAPPAPPSSLTLVSAEMFLSHSHTSLHTQVCCAVDSPLLNYVIPQPLVLPLMGSALGWVQLGTGSLGHGEPSGSFSQKPPL